MKRDALLALLERYGQRAMVAGHAGAPAAETRVFLQPILTERAGDGQYAPTPLGLGREDRFLLLGRPGLSLAAGGRVVCSGAAYVIQTAHPVETGGRRSHWWAILRPGESEATP